MTLVLKAKLFLILKSPLITCVNVSDFTSRELLENILISEEEHIDWIESQLNVIKEVGEYNYLSQQCELSD